MKYFSTLLTGANTAAANAAGGQPSITPTLVTFGLIILVFYFLIIRPQSKRQKETKEMINRLKQNDRVVTIGGIHGTIHALKDQTVVIRIDDNTKIELNRNAISSVVGVSASIQRTRGTRATETRKKTTSSARSTVTKNSTKKKSDKTGSASS